MENPYAPGTSTALPPPAPAKAPVAHKVIGGIILGFGALGLFGSIFSLAIYFTPLLDKMNTMTELMRTDAVAAFGLRGLAIYGLIYGIAEVVAGIGLFSSREWARKLAIFAALFAIVAALFSSWLSLTHVLPYSIDVALRTSPQMSDPNFTGMMRSMMMGSAIAGAAFSVIYPLIVIFFLTRPRVRVHCIASSLKNPPLIAPVA
jgi:hypothetical protein